MLRRKSGTICTYEQDAKNHPRRTSLVTAALVCLYWLILVFQASQGWATIASKCNGLYHHALEFYDYVINKKKNISQNVLTINLMICKSGWVSRAVDLFREMPILKCDPDVFTYCALMDGLCKDNRVEDAVALLDEMQIEGCSPTPATYNVLINGLCKKGDLGRAAKLLDNMFLKGCTPDEVTYNTLIHGLCLKGKLDRAGRAVDGVHVLMAMEERGYRANEYGYSALISGLFREGKSEEALKFWGKMIDKGCKPNTMINVGYKANAFTYSSLIRGFFQVGKSDKAILLWKEMTEKDCKDNEEKVDPPQDGREFLDELVLTLYKQQRLVGASKIIEVMLQSFLHPKVSTWEKVVREICKPKKILAFYFWSTESWASLLAATFLEKVEILIGVVPVIVLCNQAAE
ncbi:UNVERIFIED_CONTAM: hypothetical protein Slati_3917000 [Sesamum latifolium]|uniref:Pentatricopeptide repeat-containing protein n=1 Tax=Sesamum latifolium TaxID=2727402 RepID=A0AAW2TR46_9LAMI